MMPSVTLVSERIIIVIPSNSLFKFPESSINSTVHKLSDKNGLCHDKTVPLVTGYRLLYNFLHRKCVCVCVCVLSLIHI